jgi:hypothetical protein
MEQRELKKAVVGERRLAIADARIHRARGQQARVIAQHSMSDGWIRNK